MSSDKFSCEKNVFWMDFCHQTNPPVKIIYSVWIFVIRRILTKKESTQPSKGCSSKGKVQV